MCHLGVPLSIVNCTVTVFEVLFTLRKFFDFALGPDKNPSVRMYLDVQVQLAAAARVELLPKHRIIYTSFMNMVAATTPIIKPYVLHRVYIYDISSLQCLPAWPLLYCFYMKI